MAYWSGSNEEKQSVKTINEPYQNRILRKILGACQNVPN